MKRFLKLAIVPVLALTVLSSSVLAKGGQEMKGPGQVEGMSIQVLAGPAISEAEMAIVEVPSEVSSAKEVVVSPQPIKAPATTAAKRVIAENSVPTSASAASAVAQKLTVKQKIAQKVMQRMVKRQARRAEIGKANGGKSRILALLLCLLLGGFGIHRFYLGYTGVGVLMLFTAGLYGILILIDFIRLLFRDLQPKNGPYID